MRPTTSKNLYALAGFFVPGLGHIAQGHFLASLLFLYHSGLSNRGNWLTA